MAEVPPAASPPTAGPAAPLLTVALLEPQIPPNTGNIARLCAAAGCHLVLLGPLGFQLSDAHLKRAGLDYWDYVSWEHVPDAEAFFAARPRRSLHLLTRHASTPYTRIPAQPGDCLVFGKETTGLPPSLLERFPGQCYTIPMVEPRVRSLNLSSAAAVVVYDVLRRLRGF